MPRFTEKLDPTQADIDAVLATLVSSEQLAGRDAGYQPFSVLLSDTEGGPVTGGLYGYQLFDWLFIQYVAVPPDLKGRGIGQELMARAEAWARARGLAGLWLDTFAFQARPFYEKLGFSVFGEIKDHPRGSSRFFLQKRL
jgi:GNAT superfamily N-acetyltransferase